MAKIIIIADIKHGVLKRSTIELISRAKEMGSETAVLAIGGNIKLVVSDLADAGSDIQFLANDPALEFFSLEPYATCVLDAIAQFDADQVWFSSSESGKAMAPKVAARLKCACVTDITDLMILDEGIVVVRPAFAGKVLQRVKVNTHQFVAVIRTGVFEAKSTIKGRENVVSLSIPSSDLKVAVKEIVMDAGGEIDLAEANIVVSIGRGVKDQNGVTLVKGLANDLSAGFGTSRALVDVGIMPHASQVGQTGKVVAPSLYIAIGISGAIQHIAGMSGSTVILAVNNDPEAPIFSIADYGIVGDLFKVVPILREEIKKSRA